MNPIDKNTLYQWFANGKKPTQDHFQGLINSFYHQKEAIPIEKIAGLGDAFAQMAPLSALQGHLQDPKAHEEVLKNYAMRDARNLAYSHLRAWRTKLVEVNVLTADIPRHVNASGPESETGTGYLKTQVHDLFITPKSVPTYTEEQEKEMLANWLEFLGLKSHSGGQWDNGGMVGQGTYNK